MINIAANSTHEPLFEKFEVKPTVRISIVIPVKDEEEYLTGTLAAFLKQVTTEGAPLNSDRFEILVLANNCSDESVRLIKDFQKDQEHLHIYLENVILPVHQANIGYVRKVLMEAAYHRLSKNGGGFILTTDADTIVTPDWIAQTVSEFESGVDAVAGRILFDRDQQNILCDHTLVHHLQDEQYHLLIAELEGKLINYPHDPAPRHHQHFNGSFAITTDCFARSGGIPEVTYLEDCAFFERLHQIDAKIRHSPKVVVHTSARYVGRTEVGLSYQLSLWKNSENSVNQHLVESLDSILERLSLKKRLLDLWSKDAGFKNEIEAELNLLITEYDLSQNLVEQYRSSTYFGEWYSKFISDIHNSKHQLVPIEDAITELKRHLNNYSSEPFSQTSMR